MSNVTPIRVPAPIYTHVMRFEHRGHRVMADASGLRVVYGYHDGSVIERKPYVIVHCTGCTSFAFDITQEELDAGPEYLGIMVRWHLDARGA